MIAPFSPPEDRQARHGSGVANLEAGLSSWTSLEPRLDECHAQHVRLCCPRHDRHPQPSGDAACGRLAGLAARRVAWGMRELVSSVVAGREVVGLLGLFFPRFPGRIHSV